MTHLDREKIASAFRDLRKLGYFCRMNFWCCSSCGWSAIPEKTADKAVFFHHQDNESFEKKSQSMYLSWSGDAKEICNVLSQNGLSIEVPPNENVRIKLNPGTEIENNYV